MPTVTGSTIEKIGEMKKKLDLETTLRHLTNKIHSSSLDDILLTMRGDIQRIVDADRVTIYVKDPTKDEIYSKVKDGNDIREIRLPLGGKSIAGHVARTMKGVRIADAYNANELKQTHNELVFDQTWDKLSGYHTRQVLAVPVINAGKLQGVIQVVNKKNGNGFSEDDETVLIELSQTLAVAIQNQKRMAARRSKWDKLFMNEKITQEIIDEATKEAQKADCSIENVLIQKHKVAKSDIGESLADFYRCDFIQYTADVPTPLQLLEKFTIDYLKHRKCIPLKEDGNKVTVLMCDPSDITTYDALQQRFEGKRIVKAVGIREDIITFIDTFYGQKASEVPSPTAEDLGDILAAVEAESVDGVDKKKDEDENKEEATEDDSGIVRLANQIIEVAYSKNASDIHIEPYPDRDCMVRFRSDGVCYEYTKIPKRFARALSSRLKIMSGLDIAERRLPQDGKIKFKNYGRLDIELRVAVIPTVASQEDVVMRILAASKPLPLDNIGMTPRNLAWFKEAVQQPYGMILCVGPTGSGKTTTLHSALGFINTPDIKIWTAEDPVEITQIGLRQVQIMHKIGFTFERALRAFLRGDPDVIMVGEMRDLETAGAGVEASLTGHIVFSTLHTNSAPETITRLLDMGLDPFSFGDSLLLILAQRLVRTLCKGCKKPYKPDEAELKALEEAYGGPDPWKDMDMDRSKTEMMKGAGCDKCGNTGYKGRMGLHEVLIVDDEMRQFIYKKSKGSDIRDGATRRGMRTLLQDGIYKIVRGVTDLKEVKSVCMR